MVEVPKDHGLTPSDLDPWLAKHLGTGWRCSSVEPTSAGNSQETWFVRCVKSNSTRDLVLRRSADGGTLEWSSRGDEVTAMGEARTSGLPVPSIVWWDADGGSLSRPYIVMDRMPGGSAQMRDPLRAIRTAVDLGHLLAQLHGRTHAKTSSAPSTDRELHAWTSRIAALQRRPSLLDALVAWLHRERGVVTDLGESLLWGDPGPHNVLTDSTGGVTATLDWELSRRGNPLEDLGSARWSLLSHLDPTSLTDAYRSEIDLELDARSVDWFEVLAGVSRTVMLLNGLEALHRGSSRNLNVLALAMVMVPANLINAAAIAWGIVPSASALDGHVKSPLARPDVDVELASRLTSDHDTVSTCTINPRLLEALQADLPTGIGPSFATDLTIATTDGLNERQISNLIEVTATAQRSWPRLVALLGPTVGIHGSRRLGH